jgi:hypothetical protein
VEVKGQRSEIPNMTTTYEERRLAERAFWEKEKTDHDLRRRGQHPDQQAEAEQAQANARRNAEWNAEVAAAAAGDWDAKERVIEALNANRAVSERQVGEQFVIGGIGADMNRSLAALPLDAAARDKVHEAGNYMERERMVYDAGRASATKPSGQTPPMLPVAEVVARQLGYQMQG